MWDLKQRLSRGRISSRHIFLLAGAFMMALFMVTTVITKPALAADATRNGDTVTYNGNTYTIMQDGQVPSGLPANTNGYAFDNPADHLKSFLLTTTNAKTATSALYTVYATSSDGSLAAAPRAPPVTVSVADAPTSVPEGASTCDSSVTGQIGWILCPMVNFLANGMDHLYDILTSFLEVRPVTTNTTSSLYRMWVIVRDIANICFAIAFLVIVYSQITTIGLSNYNLKKMLPRLIIAAILVNVSYWICALAVDASNLLGYSIHDIFTNLRIELNTNASYSGVSVPTSWAKIAAIVLSGGAVGVAGYTIVAGTLGSSLILLIPILLSVTFAALVALIILAARQALITCLIIISPLAFVAFLLPNTEKHFERWRKSFMTMLLLFPIFSVIFGGAQLTGMAIIQEAGGSMILIIFGMAVQIAPVVVTPMLVKLSGSLIGRIAGMVNNPNKGLLDRNRKWARDRADAHKFKTLAGQTRGSKGMLAKGTRAIDTRRRKREGLRKLHETGAENRFAATDQGKSIDLETRREENRTSVRKAIADRHFSELTAGEATDGHFGKFKTDGHLQVRGTNMANELQENQLKVSLDGMAKRNAEFKLQSDIAKSIEGTDVHEALDNQTAREYAAGVAGVQGQASALASARGTAREQFAKFSAEYEQLRDHYMPPITDVKEFLRNPNKNLDFKDASGNVILSVDGSNMYATNAMAKHITNVGVVDEVDEMIKLSGKGQRLYDYRETIADVLAQRGYASRSIYEGGAVIELVRQGQISSTNDLYEHIQAQTAKGKVSASDLSTIDAMAIKRFTESIKFDRRVGGTNDAGAQVAAVANYKEEVAKLLQSAHQALTDPQLKGQVKGAARTELQRLQSAYSNLRHDAEGNVDLTGLSLEDIQRLL